MGASLVVVVFALLAGAFLAVSDRSFGQLRMTSGSVWVASPSRGYMTLIDGPSEQVVATVAVRTEGSHVSVAQVGTTALVADGSTGTVSAVDGATYGITSSSFASPGSELTVVTAGGSAYVIDSTSRVATIADMSNLNPIRKLALAARAGPDQVLADDGGRLWTVDADGRGLSWIDADGDHGQVGADRSARLVQVQARPALVDLDPDQPGIAWLDQQGGREQWPCELSTRPGDDVEVLGAVNAERVFVAVSQTGMLTVADSTGADCGAAAHFAEPGAAIGALAQSGQFVFVPNHSTGSTAVIDTDSFQQVANIPLTDPGHDLELLAKDGLVFYNDLDSEKAGVLRQGDDERWVQGDSLRKYDPQTGDPESPVVSKTASTPERSTTSSTTSSETVALSSDLLVPRTSSPSPPPPTTTRDDPVATTFGPQPSTTRRPTSTTSPTPPPPDPRPPVIRSITPTSTVQVGSPAAFTADVADASGDWSWTATVPPDDAVGTGTTTGSFTTDSIPKGATSILISLKVGTSDSLTLRFDVDQIEISTTTTVTYLPPPDGGTAFWTIDEITPVVNVADTAGTNVTTGTVRLTATSSSGAAVTGGDQTVELVGGEATFTALRTDTPGDLTMAVEYDGDSTHSPSGGSAVANVFQTPKEVYQGVCPLYSMEFTPDTNGADMRVTLSVDSGGSLEMTYLGPGTNAPNSSAYVHFPPYSPGEGFTAGVFDPSTQRTIQLTGNMPHGCVG